MPTDVMESIDITMSISAEEEAEACFLKLNKVSSSWEPMLMCNQDPSLRVNGTSLKLIDCIRSVP